MLALLFADHLKFTLACGAAVLLVGGALCTLRSPAPVRDRRHHAANRVSRATLARIADEDRRYNEPWDE